MTGFVSNLSVLLRDSSPEFPGLETPTPASRTFHESSMLITTPWNPPDHILRSSEPSVSAVSRQKRSDSVITNPYEGFERPPADAPNFRPRGRNRSARPSKDSPTPSIRRGGIEKILRDHGSPPGIRVTAGGRIVPDGAPAALSPIQRPNANRLGQHRGQENTPRPDQGYSQAVPLPANFDPNLVPFFQLNGFLLEMSNGHICQIVDGVPQFVGLKGGPLSLVMPATNIFSSGTPYIAQFNAQNQFQNGMLPSNVQMPGQSQVANAFNNEVSTAIAATTERVNTMEKYHATLENELKTLDRNEVLSRDYMNAQRHQGIVQQRINLTNRLDESRKAIMVLKRQLEGYQSSTANLSAMQQDNSVNVSVSGTNMPMTPITPNFMNEQTGLSSGMPGYYTGGVNLPNYDNAHNVMYAYPTHGVTQQPSAFINQQENLVPGQQHGIPLRMTGGMQSSKGNRGLGIYNAEAPSFDVEQFKAREINLDGMAHLPRRSHAIEIKQPQASDKTANFKNLNPESPNFEPKILIMGDEDTQTGDESAQNFSLARTCNTTGSDGALIMEQSLHGCASMPAAKKGQSSAKPNTKVDESGNLRASGSSATTADFFPNNAHQYSVTKHRFDEHGEHPNLAAWVQSYDQGAGSGYANYLNEATTSRQTSSDHDNTRQSDANDFDNVDHHNAVDPLQIVNANNDNSFRDVSRLDEGVRDQVPQARVTVPNDGYQKYVPLDVKHFVTPESDKRYRTPGYWLRRSRRTSAHMPTDSESDAYLQGYAIGYKQEVLGENTSPECRQGYRDGLVASLQPVSGSSHRSKQDENRQLSPTPNTKAYGIPRSQPASIASLSLPRAPVNSIMASATELNPEGSHDAILTLSDHYDASLLNRNMGTQTSGKASAGNIVPTPVVGYSGNQIRLSDTTAKPGSSGITIDNPYDHQRYAAKNKPPVGALPSKRLPQYDGSGDDDKNDNAESKDTAREKQPGATPPISPPTSPTTKSKAGGSPVKRASAAMAKLASMSVGTKKEKPKTTVEDNTAQRASSGKPKVDPDRMSSPERRKFWPAHLANIKRAEAREIEEYNRKNPLPKDKLSA